MTPVVDALDVALRIGRACDALGIAYYVGGSVASSLQGEPRATNDLDIAIDLQDSQRDAFIKELGPDFAVDEVSLRDEVRRRGFWNTFYLPLSMKIDLFIRKYGSFERAEYEHAREIRLDGTSGGLRVTSAENIVLRKILWFIDGGSVSERQWRDIVEVLRVCARSLDDAYLDQWADWLNVTRWLTKARAEALRPPIAR